MKKAQKISRFEWEKKVMILKILNKTDDEFSRNVKSLFLNKNIVVISQKKQNKNMLLIK